MAKHSHKDWDKPNHGHGHQHSSGHPRHRYDEDEDWRGNKRSRNFGLMEDEDFEPISKHDSHRSQV